MYSKCIINQFNTFYNILRKIYNDIQKDNYLFITKYHNDIYKYYNNERYNINTKIKIIYSLYIYFKSINDNEHKEYYEKILNILKKSNTESKIIKQNINMNYIYEKTLEQEKNRFITYKNELIFLTLYIHLFNILRTDFYITCKIFTNNNERNNEDNYIFIDLEKEECYYYVNKDKVSTRQGYKNNEELKKIVLPIETFNIFYLSYKKYKRKYLFQSNLKKEKPINNKTLLNYLHIGLNNKIINNRQIRKIYESDRFIKSLKNNNLQQFINECKNQRHKVEIVLTTYIQSENIMNDINNHKENKLDIYNNKNIKENNKIENKEKHKENQRKYLKKNKDNILIKNYIYKLNNNIIKKVNKNKLIKNNIYYDDNTKKYKLI